ncbi:menaquinone biosynthesis protein [Streptomyces kunmingensis]|uniref:Chorismate dehydratase n=1 Tax=Streptomyces kunmingensis TaxID=68225 RepID=A0ABU6C4H8_9ACTN|nr:menaquinone biosynthesis protein [Streptomyces kunmingensis]MEB3959106.1 menaquinone biosynthesis protein [Streptomyces kunmingensis]
MTAVTDAPALAARAADAGRPRVGHIDFLNCLPLYWGLARTGSLLDLDLRRDSPERLSDALVAGELDISAISVMEYLRHAEDLVVLPDIAVGADGPVMSCLLLSKVPLDQLDGVPLACTTTSRTTVRLAELLLSEKIGVRPEYFSCPPDLPTMMAGAPAAVVIGDAALRASLLQADTFGFQVYDLAEMWREWTGLPFVFAVFAARREFVAEHAALVREVHAGFLASRALFLDEIDVVCHKAARWAEFDADTLKRYYLSALDFDLGDRQLAGLREFARRVGGSAAGFPADPGIHLLDTERAG